MPGDEARSLTGDGRWRTHIPKFPFFGISREAQKRTGTAKSLLRFNFLAEWTGLEPATPGVTGRYSNQLNYHSAWCNIALSRAKRCKTWRPYGDSNPGTYRERVMS